jgi:soluble lytic murein transglycosylase
MGAPIRRIPAAGKVLLILLAVILLAYLLYNSSWYKRMRYPLKYEDHIRKYAEEYSVDPYLAASLIWVESGFETEAVSGRNARGLMQILPSTAAWGAEKMGLAGYEEAMLLDPEKNIRIGCWYLGYLSNQFPGSMQLTLAAYNGGIGNVQKWLQDKAYSKDGKQLDHIPFPETRNYVLKVMHAYEIYKEIYPSLDFRSR